MSTTANSQDARPSLTVQVEPRVCAQYVGDVTIGCSFGCVYCPFSHLAERKHRIRNPTLTDISVAIASPAPPFVLLSGSSDAFAPQAARHTHALLERWLPQGTVVGIVTKGIMPDKTLDLLHEFRCQIEGVSIGLTSLDERRNQIIEPGCPPAAERLAAIARAARRQLPVVLRIDPIFPGVDDDAAALGALLSAADRNGAGGIVAGYVFAWGRYLRRLRRVPMLADACSALIERTPMAGGFAWGVPLARKVNLYTRLAELAARYGLYFQTCGCKDLRLHEYEERFATRCTANPFFTQRLPVAQ
jgi:DNA repair photolyase